MTRTPRRIGIDEPAAITPETALHYELTRDWTQQRIADACGVKHQQRVQKYIACARNYPPGGNRPAFILAYDEVNGAKSKAQLIVGSDNNEWYTPAKYVEAARLAWLRKRANG